MNTKLEIRNEKLERRQFSFSVSAFQRLSVCAWFFGLLAFCSLSFAAPQTFQKKRNTPADCAACHTCKNPDQTNPCLTLCPRPRATSQDIIHAPETVLLYELENEYEPVAFNHRTHAQMSAMGGECADCHHFGEGGRIEACKQCHSLTASEDMRQPGLKGAYHRQCMKCHEQWSGETNCENCHIKKGMPGPLTAANVAGAPHETHMPGNLKDMQQPDKKVWQSSYNGGTVVTLHHKNHTEKYGIDCAACHHAEGCGSCHSKQGTTAQVSKSEQALHATCNACHAEMSCGQCHQQSEAVAFNHDRTGFQLGKQHSKLQCKSCHGDPYHFTKPKADCNGCHNNFAEGKFNHAATGVSLDENHKEIGCEICHVKRAFAEPPKCTECHGAEVAYPAKVPGARVKGKH
jgi:hypothetical protein